MICVNCGWDNPDGLSFCQKCNEPLAVIHTPAQQETGRKEEEKPASSCRKCGYPILPGTDSCPNCGAQVRPLFGQSAEPAPEKNRGVDGRVTVKLNVAELEERIGKSGAFGKETIVEVSSQKKPIWRGKETVKDASSFRFDNDVKNRDAAKSALVLRQLDFTGLQCGTVTVSEENSKLDSAEFTFADGAWRVNDVSSSSRIFIQVNKPAIVCKGDVLIVDGKKYIVE